MVMMTMMVSLCLLILPLDIIIFKNFQEQSTVEKFKSQGGAFVHEFCDHGTRADCRKNNPQGQPCRKVTKN